MPNEIINNPLEYFESETSAYDSNVSTSSVDKDSSTNINLEYLSIGKPVLIKIKARIIDESGK